MVAPHGAPLLARCEQSGIPQLALRIRGEVDPIATWRLWRLLKRERPQILHLHDGHAVFHGQLAGRALSRQTCRVVAHRRTVFPLKGRWKYGGRVDRVIAISSAVRSNLLKAGLSDEKIRVVYSGMEIFESNETFSGARKQWRDKLGVGSDDILVVHAAALSREKRQVDLIAAICDANETLKACGGPCVHLALAGCGTEEETLHSEVARRGAQAMIHCLGFVEAVESFFAAGDLALYGSEAEGLCTALVQAQGCGLPAVVTNAGGMPEVIEAGQTGYVVEIGDTKGMSQRIVELALDKQKRQSMGAAGRVRAKKMFSSQAMVDGVMGVYGEWF
jgi:glycosyltransferase involved in cell wall biosynthesis